MRQKIHIASLSHPQGREGPQAPGNLADPNAFVRKNALLSFQLARRGGRSQNCFPKLGTGVAVLEVALCQKVVNTAGIAQVSKYDSAFYGIWLKDFNVF